MKKSLSILLIQLLLVVPTCSYQKIDRGTRSLDEYWSESNIKSEDFESLIADSVCYTDKNSYLACVNSISAILSRYNRILALDGEFLNLSTSEIKKRMTEKDELRVWAENFEQGRLLKNPTFIGLYRKILGQFVKDKQRNAVIASGINGYLSVAKDPHTYIVPLAFYEEVIASSEAKLNHLGFLAKRQKEYVLVRKVFDGSPADKAGLLKGDHILSVNGSDVNLLMPTQLNELLRLKGFQSKMILKIERVIGLQKKSLVVEIQKEEYVSPSVASKIIENSNQKIGVITINKFAKQTCMQTKQALIQLKESGLQGLLLDLRDNPGGQVEEAACILGLFVPKGTALFETRYTDPLHPVDRYKTEDSPIYKGAMAVLINSGSASASEIVAGVLKDLGRSVLVGERTFGKGTFQDGRIWSPHHKIAYFETEGMYYFPSGWTPQLVGIEPDIKVTFDEESFREGDLYFKPVRPKDLWTGPQALTWLQIQQCENEPNLWAELLDMSSDPQMQKAKAWLNCKQKVGSKND